MWSWIRTAPRRTSLRSDAVCVQRPTSITSCKCLRLDAARTRMSSSQPEQMKNSGNQPGLTEIPELHLGAGAQLTDDQTVSQLAALLPEFLSTRRWYRAKARTIDRVDIDDVVSVPEAASYILLIRVRFRE